MPHALLALGSNLGARLYFIRMGAAEFLDGPPRSNSRLVSASSLYETAPVGGPNGQRPYLNAAIRVDTPLSARDLLARIGEIERRAGRTRVVVNGPRTLDVDILLFDDVQVSDHGLVVPHPRMHERRFVLEPAAEIAADWIHPVLRRPLRDLADSLRRHTGPQPDRGEVRRVAGPEWLHSPADDL